MSHASMENIDNTSIPIWVKIVAVLVLSRENHYISSGARIDNILFPATVVCGVIDSECAVTINAIIFNDHAEPLFIGEFLLISIVREP